MPRIKLSADSPRRVSHPELIEELAQELKSQRDAGQPRIEEQHFPRTGAIRVTVLWDKWVPVVNEERTTIILAAYERAEGREFRDRIALAIGLTMREARASGLLPFQIIAALRPDDPVTEEDCRKAMIAEGASTLWGEELPRLCFATEEEAEASRLRLAERLPGSKPVWIITRQETEPTEDWAQLDLP